MTTTRSKLEINEPDFCWPVNETLGGDHIKVAISPVSTRPLQQGLSRDVGRARWRGSQLK